MTDLLYPNFYADGYIAIAFHICLFVCSDVRLFVRSPLLSSMVVEQCQSFDLHIYVHLSNHSPESIHI